RRVWHILGIRRFYPKHMPNSVLVTYEAMIINMFATTRIKNFVPGHYQSVIFIKQILSSPIAIIGIKRVLPIVIDFVVVTPDVKEFHTVAYILADSENLRLRSPKGLFILPPH